MPSFLVTLASRTNSRTGLGIFDTKAGFHYLQDDSPAIHQLPFSPYRGIAQFEQHIFITTPHSIRIYEHGNTSNAPLFILQREINHFDWSLVPSYGPYPGLIPILHSTKRNSILVGNNSLCCIDELSGEGTFLGRFSLGNIAPDIFVPPEQFSLNFTYGQIRHLCETAEGEILVTVANCNNSSKGKIINFETGASLLNDLHDPHGGLVYHDHFFLQDSVKGLYRKSSQNGKLLSYDLTKTQTLRLNGLAWEAILQKSTDKSQYNLKQLQGMAISNERIFCGASFFGKPSEQTSLNHIVSFDLSTGEQKDLFDIPDLEEFRNPQVASMTLLPEEWQISQSHKLVFFQAGNQITPNPYQPKPEKLEKSTPEPANKTTPPQQETPLVTKGIPVINVPKEPTCNSKKKPAIRKKLSISIDHVSLCYRRVGSFLFSLTKKNRVKREYWALKDVSTSIYEGETIGLIGRNGSGKSTIAMAISGALMPDKGKITTYGRVQLLALGIGFRPQLTGRENVLISGTILGMSRKAIKAKMDEIEEFAELGDFFDEPIRTYSAGMKSRLGFAVSTAVQPDILILDEVMSTGDAAFRIKANKRMKQMREKTKTVLVVSHNPSQIKELCSRVVWLEQGRLLMDGSTDDILPIYEQFCKMPDKWLADHSEISALLTGPEL